MKSFYLDDKSRIIHKPCLKAMRLMKHESVDSIVTDGPYGLKFMGKAWDHGVPGVTFWKEALRVAKPGAYLLAFGGTRTFHRLMVAIEDAGWEIRDTIMWVYGCLSDDTEILVDGKWEPYHKAIAGSRVLAYDPVHESFVWQTVEKLYVYSYDDTAYHIKSEFTDQIVSRNHRCLVEHEGGGYSFKFAEEAARQHEIRVPVLEDLQGLLDALPLPQSLSGGSEQDLFTRMCGSGDARPTISSANGSADRDGQDHLCLRVSEMETPLLDEASEETDLFKPLQREITSQGTGEAQPQRLCGMDGGVATVLSREDEWPEQPGMEGWRDDFQEAWELQGRSIRSVSSGVQSDGSQGWLCDGASFSGREDFGAMPVSEGSCASRRPQASQQQVHELDAVCLQPRSQAVRTSWKTRTDLARIIPLHYRGIVWCVKVPSGAFVARRNGKVFITGNSGFPKGMNIGKAIDKSVAQEQSRREQSRFAGVFTETSG